MQERTETWAFPNGGIVVEAAHAPTGTTQAAYRLAAYLGAALRGALGILVSRRDLSAETLGAVYACAQQGLHILPLTVDALAALINSQMARWARRIPLGAVAALGAIERAHRTRLRA
jgi:hypothetical protein